LILLDLEMAGMDGFQVMEGLKSVETEGYIPVLVLTSEPAHRLRALQAGAKDFISKPFDQVEALTRIHGMLEVRLLLRESRSHGQLLERTNETVRDGEARLASVVSSAMDAIITVDAEQRVVVFNAAAERMFRCSSREAMGGTIERFIPSRFHPSHHEHIQNSEARASLRARLAPPAASPVSARTARSFRSRPRFRRSRWPARGSTRSFSEMSRSAGAPKRRIRGSTPSWSNG
jgi:CheY-like chemotaxis protein